MSQQINLFDPSLLRKRELLTAANLAVTAAVLLVGIGAWGAFERMQLARLEAEVQGIAPETKTLEEQLIALAKRVQDAKPSTQLEAQLAAAKSQLALRGDILAALKKGVGGGGVSFAEYLRGLARQTVPGLWLTGFSVGEDGAGMEIRGRMSVPAALPEYIRRLNSEKAFKGKGFARLTVGSGKGDAPAAATGMTALPEPRSARESAPGYLDFVLAPVQGETVAPGASAESAKLASASPLSDLPLPETVRGLSPGKTAEPKR